MVPGIIIFGGHSWLIVKSVSGNCIEESMMSTLINVGVAAKLGKYSDAVLVEGEVRWLYSSGTPGLDADGQLPGDFESQARLAWAHVLAMLTAAQMDVSHIVKLTQTLTRREDLVAYRAVRNDFLGDARPASMLSFVSGLVLPEMLIELEIVAAK